MRRRDAPAGGVRDRAGALARGALGVALCATLVLAFVPAALARRAKPKLTQLSVSIGETNPETRVPPEFLGLSFELASLGQIARYGESGDLVTMLRSLGHGVLRFGGVTADIGVAWVDQATARPSWASSSLEARELRELGTLAARSGWRILLTIGLGHYEP